MVAKCYMCVNNVSNMIYYFIFINKQGKQHKIKKETRSLTLSQFVLDVMCGSYFASREPPVEYTAIKI